MKIKKFLEINDKNISYRLKRLMYIYSLKYTYMFEISVLKFYKIRSCGVKDIRELLEVYPECENEIGWICYDTLKNHK